MADDLSLSVRTIERNFAILYRKIEAYNRAEAMACAFQHELIEVLAPTVE